MDKGTGQTSLRALEIPVPPADVRYRIASSPIDEANFLASGELCASDVLRSLAAAGIEAGDFRSILDFGCGCSRVLRYLRPHLARAAFHGWDVDEVGIAWSREHCPGVPFDVVPHLPPTSCPSASFDFIYGLSVFSHLDLPRQLLWLEELHRVLRPGGVLLLTVHGQFALDEVKDSITTQQARDFQATGFLFLANIGDRVLPDWYQTAIYREDFARLVFGSRFDVLGYRAKGMCECQDVVLLRRRAPATEGWPGGLTR